MVKKEVPKRGSWLSWWKRQWTGADDPHSEVHPDHNTEPAKAPDEAEARLDKIGGDSEEEVKLSREETNPEVKEEGDKEWDEEVKLPKEEEDAKAKDGGGK